MQMSIEIAARALDVDLLARELGNWRTSSRSGPVYQGLSDAIRLLIVDGRLPVGLQLIGRPGDDAGVLQASSVFERIQPWEATYRLCRDRALD